MRATLDELVPEPIRAERQAHFRENSGRFAAKEVFRFDRVFFSFRNEPEDTDALLAQPRGDADTQELGETFRAGSNRRPMSRQEMLPILGAVFADLLTNVDRAFDLRDENANY